MIVRNLDDAETLEIALVENIQRQDLNAIEEADTYRKLIDDQRARFRASLVQLRP